MKSDIDRKLIDACNLLCEYVAENMPPGYVLTMDMGSVDASLSLTDPDGDDVYFYGGGDSSLIRDACDSAKELQGEKT